MGWGRALLLKLYRGQRSFLVLYTQSGPEMASAWRVCIRNGSHGHSYNMPILFIFTRRASSIVHHPPPSSCPLRCCHQVSNKPLTSSIAQRHGVAAGSDTSAYPSPTSRRVGMVRRGIAVLSGPAMISVTPRRGTKLSRRVWNDRQDAPSTRPVQSAALDQLLLGACPAHLPPYAIHRYLSTGQSLTQLDGKMSRRIRPRLHLAPIAGHARDAS